MDANPFRRTDGAVNSAVAVHFELQVHPGRESRHGIGQLGIAGIPEREFGAICVKLSLSR
jgi:hypothetical protein